MSEEFEGKKQPLQEAQVNADQAQNDGKEHDAVQGTHTSLQGVDGGTGAETVQGAPSGEERLQKGEGPQPLFLADTPLREQEARVLADNVSKKSTAVVAGSVFIICAVLSVLFGFMENDMVYGISFLVCGALAAIVLAFVFPVIVRKNAIKNVLYQNAINRVAVFEDRMECLTFQNGVQVSYTLLYFFNIKKIVRVRGYLLIYLSEMQALILSEKGFSVGTADAFADYCRARGVRILGDKRA